MSNPNNQVLLILINPHGFSEVISGFLNKMHRILSYKLIDLFLDSD